MKADNNYNSETRKMLELVELSDEIIFWEVDSDFVIQNINQTISEQIGYSKEEVIGHKLNDIIIPYNKSSWDNAIAELQEPSSFFNNIKFRIKSATGQIMHLNTHARAVFENDQLIGYFGISIIETENVLTKQAIKNLQTTNRIILDSLSEALLIIDRNEKFLAISPEFNNMWGFNKGDLFIQTLDETYKIMQEKISEKQQGVLISFTQNFDKKSQTRDTIHFKDGRIIERRSVPHISNDEIAGTCWYYKDITNQTQLVDRLAKLAFRDSLTNLYSRRWCEKKLKQLLKKTYDKSKLSFMYMDLDYFKVINDSCGHIYGDDVLGEVSQILQETSGKDAYLARLGGDEFGLILSETSQQEVIALAEKIKSAISNYTYQWKSKIFKLGISIGIVFVENEDDFRSVFIHADEACYVSKKLGKNKYTIYNAENFEFKKTQTELKWYDALQKTLLKGKFELWCQSINSLEPNSQSHYEILIRMRNEQGELISPALFMPSADRFGMNFAIDKQVIELFCNFYDAHREQINNTLFSINISGLSLSKDSFLPYVLNCMNKYNIDPKIICFEVTENEVIKNLEKALEFIKHVRQMGCKISLDDFGKGLTSFSYLKNIEYDFIKIDGQFIKEINKDKINKAIISSIVSIAEITEKQTIAEHIESEESLNQISALGVNFFQGNYFSSPHQITKLIE